VVDKPRWEFSTKLTHNTDLHVRSTFQVPHPSTAIRALAYGRGDGMRPKNSPFRCPMATARGVRIYKFRNLSRQYFWHMGEGGCMSGEQGRDR
jgi:hypothetical protein